MLIYDKDIISWNPKAFSCLDTIQVQFSIPPVSTTPPRTIVGTKLRSRAETSIIKMWEESIKCPLQVTQRQNSCAQRQFPLFSSRDNMLKGAPLAFTIIQGEEEGAQIKSRMDAPRRFTEILEPTGKASWFGKTELLLLGLGVRKKGLWTWRRRIGELTLI